MCPQSYEGGSIDCPVDHEESSLKCSVGAEVERPICNEKAPSSVRLAMKLITRLPMKAFPGIRLMMKSITSKIPRTPSQAPYQYQNVRRPGLLQSCPPPISRRRLCAETVPSRHRSPLHGSSCGIIRRPPTAQLTDREVECAQKAARDSKYGGQFGPQAAQAGDPTVLERIGVLPVCQADCRARAEAFKAWRVKNQLPRTLVPKSDMSLLLDCLDDVHGRRRPQ